ncbi:steroidogenic acute regulatory protein, mitochondrial isoform X1 [Entelurus aequoreus]|uniref:steroidogenic acute regulatory protein, mitochondrial isoform X1 n=2 Tax=Entelurus aequoreus TaxID=161455 RepID=UPI002B1D4464|nr:steroidogenic acute regulatory protein, mitochondrial isoform X1 [Entelurus aequoreus]
MLPAVVKLCCGISYPHLRSLAGLQRTAMAVIGQEISHLQRCGHVPQRMRTLAGLTHDEHQRVNGEVLAAKGEQQAFVRKGHEAMTKALGLLEQKDGWKVEIIEGNGDVIYSKVVQGSRKVFRLEVILDADLEELYDILFARVEEMHQWNPSIQQIKVLKRVGPETMVTHEVSAQTAGNLIGRRDFLSVRHSCKRKSRIYLGGGAIQLEAFPPLAGFVRAEDGPTCMVIEALGDGSTQRSRFTWLVNMDVKGWLPKSIVNQALPRAQLDFTRHLRRRLTAGAPLG